jgi:hypothetical protein
MVNRDKVRLLISDRDPPPSQIYTDAEIDAFLDMADNNIFMAAYYAAIGIVSSSVTLAKMEKIGDYTCDRKSIAADFRHLAELLKQTAEQEPAMAFGQWVNSDFQGRDAVFNKFLRRSR